MDVRDSVALIMMKFSHFDRTALYRVTSVYAVICVVYIVFFKREKLSQNQVFKMMSKIKCPLKPIFEWKVSEWVLRKRCRVTWNDSIYGVCLIDTSSISIR